MNDNTLIRVFGAFAAICVVVGAGIIFKYDGDKAQAFGLLGGLILLFIPTLLGFKKSADAAEKAQTAVTKVDTMAVKVDAGAAVSEENNKTLAVIAPQVQEAVSAVADNTALTQQTQQTSKETHQAVNHRMDDLIAQVKEQGRTLAELAGMRGREAGIKEGLQQAADASGPHEQTQTAEPGADDTIEVIAPATIKVIPPVEPRE